MTLIQQFKSSTEGQLVQVNDVDLLIELDEKAPKTLASFLIKKKRFFSDGDTQLVVLTLDHVGSDLEYLLVGSIFEDALDVKLFLQPDFFKSDRRDVLVKGDNGWLFDFDSYAQELYCDDIVFVRKVQPEVFHDTAVIEWDTESKIINHLQFLIETGIHGPNGGWVEFYEGRLINENDVTF
jgi:hypothetical protein